MLRKLAPLAKACLADVALVGELPSMDKQVLFQMLLQSESIITESAHVLLPLVVSCLDVPAKRILSCVHQLASAEVAFECLLPPLVSGPNGLINNQLCLR